MKLATARFGEVEIADDQLVTFPEGMPGFRFRRFALLPDASEPGVEWLQSLEEPGVALVVADPSLFIPDYTATPRLPEIRAIVPEGEQVPALACRVIVRRGAGPDELILNLFAPIFINLERRVAMQVPLVGSGYDVRQVWSSAGPPA